MTIARGIAGWALSLSPDDVPDHVRRAARLHLTDGLGTALAAVRLDAAAPAVAVAQALGGPEEATILGSADRVSAPAAALANGGLVHALDFDDTHTEALVHATAATLPAAFAVGEQTGAPGADVLAAAIAGYELVIRLGAAVPHAFHERGFHATSVCGVFASALIASKLMRLSTEETVNAIGIAGSAAAGSLEFLHTGASTKQLHPGLSGMSGILAARLAAAGAQGPESIFEGEYGLFHSYIGAEVSDLSKDLGTRWRTPEIAFKLHPACHLSIGSLELLQQMLPKLDDASRIEEIAFDVPAGSIPIICEPVDAKRRPRTPYEAKFSLPYSAALMIVDGRLTIDSFEPASLNRDEVRVLADRITYRTIQFDGAPADAPSGINVRVRDGEPRSEARVKPVRPTGSEEDVLAKFFENTGGTADGLAEAVLSLDERPNLGFLREFA